MCQKCDKFVVKYGKKNRFQLPKWPCTPNFAWCLQWGHTLTHACFLYTSPPSHSAACATMLLTSTPLQTQTSSDGTGSPLFLSFPSFPYLFHLSVFLSVLHSFTSLDCVDVRPLEGQTVHHFSTICEKKKDSIDFQGREGRSWAVTTLYLAQDDLDQLVSFLPSLPQSHLFIWLGSITRAAVMSSCVVAECTPSALSSLL